MFSLKSASWILLSLLIVSVESADKKENEKVAKVKPKGLSLRDITFVVISQPNSYHLKRSSEFKEHFKDQTKDLSEKEKPKLYFTHEKWDLIGAFTVLPLLPIFAQELKDSSWIFICEEETRLSLPRLLDVLRKYDPNKEYFLGKALHDREATIIHHFANANNPSAFSFPDFGTGIALSRALFMSVGQRWPDDSIRSDFTIDPKHELALALQHGNNGASLTDVPELCTFDYTEKCASWFPVKFPDCGPEIPEEDLFVGVKTCEKFHKERVPIVKETWGKDTKNIEYFSEKEDPSIPTIDLGVPNTERGHCGKTMAMLRRWLQDKKFAKVPWFLIADDDTIINLRRLRKLLACYDPKEPVHLGEMYAYAVAKKNWGYTYITGGGGMVFSREAINRLVTSGESDCSADDSPDDMTLGMRYKRIDISLVHSPYFHQARPVDYSTDFLAARTPLSFHKHWMSDPRAVYEDLMKEPESTNRPTDSGTTTTEKSEDHEEL
ncbi:beta-1,3-glucosyltransferase-like [Ostrea edulis]|uniref:beta-1,3-glucosyltransferase-like n=1 Tax=Ostrea edulis TaxID=37623 RepID=UPI0024AF62FE|nr:beta-1,3-glucosyltransferase-like [Ostrea edulis]